MWKKCLKRYRRDEKKSPISGNLFFKSTINVNPQGIIKTITINCFSATLSALLSRQLLRKIRAQFFSQLSTLRARAIYDPKKGIPEDLSCSLTVSLLKTKSYWTYPRRQFNFKMSTQTRHSFFFSHLLILSWKNILKLWILQTLGTYYHMNYLPMHTFNFDRHLKPCD